ncbi:melatonin receptor type 1C-like [Tubulanus polymorphus]|uniref:melatonin receptor type 1C-like n=1 Tax=Tubulanus polymorphus TaxID=672921 RepID=UPI003DA5D1FC
MAQNVNSSLDLQNGSAIKTIQDVDFFQEHPVMTYIYLTILIIFTITGNIGNTMVIGAVLTDKRLWSKGNVFIMNLAIADMCVTGFVNPFSICGVVLGPKFFIYRWVLCRIIGSICLVSCTCSLWNIAAISFNRYILICVNRLYNTIFTWKKTIAYAVSLWVIAWVLLDLPNYLFWGSHAYDMKTMACSYDRLASFSYTAFFVTMFVTIPLITVFFCNVSIYNFVRRQKLRVFENQIKPAITADADTNEQSMLSELDNASRNWMSKLRKPTNNKVAPNQACTSVNAGGFPMASHKDEVDKQTKKQGKGNPCRSKVNVKDIKLAKTLLIVFIIFLICWTPYASLCIFDFADRVPKVCYIVAITMAHINSSVNSIFYGATNSHFRAGYKAFLKRLRCYPSVK